MLRTLSGCGHCASAGLLIARRFPRVMIAYMSSSLPIVYVKTGCPWCEEVLEFLEGRRIPFQKVTVTGNRETMDAMVALSGQSKAPTMDWNGEVLADFGVDELVPFLKERGVI